MNPSSDLGRCRLFHGFTETGLQILASIAHETSLEFGATVFSEDDPADSLYVIASGIVAIRMKGPDGRQRTLALLEAGESFGELALLTPGGARLVSAVARTPVRLLELRQRDFARLQTQKPQACLKLILNIAGEFGRKMADNRALLRSLLLPAVRR